MSESFRADSSRITPLLNRTSLGKTAEVEDIVNSVMFLLSNKSDMITGHHLPVDGGYLMA